MLTLSVMARNPFIYKHLLIRSLLRRINPLISEPPARILDTDYFIDHFNRILTQASNDFIKNYGFYHLPGHHPPWLETEIEVAKGDAVTIIAAGQVLLSDIMDIRLPPYIQLWMRIGESGGIFRGTQNTHTFFAPEEGHLFLGNRFPGDWENKTGALFSRKNVYHEVKGGMNTLLIHWQKAPLAGLKALRELGDVCGLFADEINRLAQSKKDLGHWTPPWNLGSSAIFNFDPLKQHNTILYCHARQDQGGLERVIDCALDPATRLSWRWKMHNLPSALPEDTVLTHDLVAISVMFQNGKEMAYTWSARLKKGKIYPSPEPARAHFKKYVVIRSGKKELHQWVPENRNIFKDYQMVFKESPGKIYAIRITVSNLYQRLEVDCQFTAILLENHEAPRKLL